MTRTGLKGLRSERVKRLFKRPSIGLWRLETVIEEEGGGGGVEG